MIFFPDFIYTITNISLMHYYVYRNLPHTYLRTDTYTQYSESVLNKAVLQDWLHINAWKAWTSTSYEKHEKYSSSAQYTVQCDNFSRLTVI